MQYVNNVYMHDHWQMLREMLEENYAHTETNNTMCVLGSYVHKPVEVLRQEFYPDCDKLIVYQLEPLVKDHWWRTEHIVNNIKNADEVWDYDLQNIEVLRSYGIDAKFKPPAYTNSLRRIQPAKEHDIDVLFYGSHTQYRQQFIDNYFNKSVIDPNDEVFSGMNLVWVYNISDRRLDDYIARSKIILNLNPYSGETRQQQTRILYPLINNKCVVSQRSPINYFGDAICEFDDYTDLSGLLRNLISSGSWANARVDDKKFIGNKSNGDKIAIFYHIAQLGDWRSIFENQIVGLQQSGLYDAADYIHFGVNGSEPLPYNLSKVNRTVRNKREHLEADTMYDMWKFCQANPDYKVLYIHAKGVTHSLQHDEHARNVNDWRIYLEHFVVKQWKRCIDALEHNDCVGTEWEDIAYLGDKEFPSPHYAGNFWWANASYINKLDPEFLYVDNDWSRWQAELWVGTAEPKYHNFYSSGKNKYTQRIDPSEYSYR